MLELHTLRESKETVVSALKKRGLDAAESIDELLALDESRRSLQAELDNVLAEANHLAKEIGMLFKAGKGAEAEALKTKTAYLKERSKVLQEELNEKAEALIDALYLLPNTPHESVPSGKNETDNKEVFSVAELPELDQEALPHWELAKKYDLIDFELGVKIAGAGFPVYKGKGARLQRALISFFLDKNIEAGYLEIQPPHVVNAASGYGTGQLPDKEGQMYHITNDDLYLIPTAEVPITNILRDVILNESELPITMTAYTPCFRREAGSYGSDVRGLNRLHQFDKVEIVRIEKPENSYQALEGMVEHVKTILEALELPYRILQLCGGDLGFTSALTYDFEVYSAAQKRWLEISSISNFETFQANRLKLRIKDNHGKKTLAHTLNGSALALPRVLAALLENHQTPDGIYIPKALVPYTHFERIN
jgi:seryl-tRNA synthetase